MTRRPMTVGEMKAMLAPLPDSCLLAHVDGDGTVGYFFAEDQNAQPDDGHVHLELGDCE